MIKRLVLLAAILLGSVAVAAPAGAQYEGLCGIIVDPTNLAPGGQLSVSGQGAEPGSDLELLFGDTVLSTTTAALDTDGTFFFPPVSIPSNVAAGDYTVTVREVGGAEFQCEGVDVLTGTVTVSTRSVAVATGGGTTGTGSGSLPRTGSDSLPLAQLGALLVVFGGLGVLAARKRRSPVSV